ncbi:MAG: aminotransferase class V-fold PLP-dependent enzyme, partial [Bacteroidota bacterium]
MNKYIYLDHAATTPVDPRVLDEMLPYLRENFGNPSSIHEPGRLAKAAIERAREQVASLINASPAEVVFTSGGTESD